MPTLEKKSSNKLPDFTLLTYWKMEEQSKLKVSRRKEVTKIRAEINETETKKPREQINETRSSTFEKIFKNDKPLARLIQKTRERERERENSNKIRNEREEITTPQ